jgi:NAD(P)-dependent dehydrogenase (short-subunit alcohol dehydrogenase family)
VSITLVSSSRNLSQCSPFISSGLGYASIKYLARRGAKVYLAARNETKANDAIARLKEEGLDPGNGEVVWLKLDLSDPREAKKSAEHFLTLESRLDVLSRF